MGVINLVMYFYVEYVLILRIVGGIIIEIDSNFELQITGTKGNGSDR